MKLAAPLVLALAAPLPAQRVVTYTLTPYEVRLFDLDAGAVLESFTIDLSLAQPPLGVFDWKGAAIGVRDEIWVSGGSHVYRFDATGNQLGATGPFVQPRGMTVFAGSVWVAAGTQLHELAIDGTLLNSYPTATPVRGLLAWHGRLLASTALTIDEYDASGKFLGTFSQPPPPPLDMDTGQLADSPSTGNLLVTGVAYVYELDPTGAVVGVYNAGSLEQGVQELPDGRLLVSLSSGVVAHDRVSEETVQVLMLDPVMAMAPFRPGGAGAERHCGANPNSTGAPARINAFGELSLAGDDLTLDASSLPPGSPGIFFYGPGTTQLPWGDGFLCTGPFDLHRVPSVVVASPNGFAERRLEYSELPPDGTILPGSTWSFQLVYRDPAAGGTGFNSTDAVRLTFEP